MNGSADRPRVLQDIFAATVREHGDRIAVDVPPGRGRPERILVTYAELDARARRLAAIIATRAAPDDLVAVLLPRDSEQLYVAQLAVLFAGAAHTCLDPAFPDAFVAAALADAAPRVIITDAAGRERPGLDGDHVLDPEVDEGEGASRWSPPPTSPEHLAYVIYTSGTTGRPKGVMIEHRGVVNLVASDVEEFGLGPGDRVAQGSSAAYDSSVEEIWLAFAVGATVVLLDDDTARLGPDLVPWLRDEGITVFCPTPTLLRMTACRDPLRELPGIRLVYTGGEAIPQDLVDSWAPGRRLENGYGPTECTVTVVRARLNAGRAVVIGRPVPGHAAHVLDDRLEAVPDGGPGELCIAGPGLARGYLGRPEVTAERFIVHPRFGRIYRTGDLVRRDETSDLVYLGRIDGQVKLRGFRIELGAIESRLVECDGVHAAACTVRGDGSMRTLAAWIVAEDPTAPPEPAVLARELARVLPAYMVPSRISLLETLPTTVGGKLDRAALPELAASTAPATIDADDPVEHAVLATITAVLGIDGAAVDDDFFVDLGGDSLSAVAVICALRERGGADVLAVRDLYEARTTRRLALRLREELGSGSRPFREETGAAGPLPGAWQIRAVTALQGMAIAIGGAAVGVLAWWMLFRLAPWVLSRCGVTATLLGLPVAAALARPVLAVPTIAFAVMLKRMLIGRYRPGVTPVWSWFWLRHWLCQRAAGLIPWGTLEGTVFHAAALRALGARIGRRVHIHRGVDLHHGGWDLIEIGDDVTLAQDATLAVCELEQGRAWFDHVRVMDGATLEVRATVSRGATVERDGYLTALSWLRPGDVLAADESWDGVPATRTGTAPRAPDVDSSHDASPLGHGLRLIAARAVVSMVTVVPATVALLALVATAGLDSAIMEDFLARPRWTISWAAWTTAVVIASTPLTLFLRAFVVRALGPVPVGAVSRWSDAYIRIWLVTGEVEAAGRWLSGSLFWPTWLRIAGMKIGPKAEVSSIHDVVCSRVEIGERSFFADGVYLGCPRVHRGTVAVGHTVVGRETFFGNHVVVPTASRLPDGYFLGVSTVADASVAAPGSAWFGHPPMELPRRDVVQADSRTTFDPTPLRFATRVFWETSRFALPSLPLAVAAWWHVVVALAPGHLCPALLAAMLTTAVGGAMAVPCAAILALKWGLLGRVRPGTHPFWSCWCGRWDLVYMAWQIIARPVLVTLEGTLFLTIFLRAMGMKIGRRVVLGGGFAQVVDPDMLRFGDGVTVSALFQAHSFEDRVLKIAPVELGEGSTVGHGTVLFYGAKVGDGAWIGPQGVVMKNERIAGGGVHVGAPSRSVAG